MSNEQTKPERAARFSAAWIVRPSTNWSPITPDGGGDGAADHRLAEPARQAFEEASEVLFRALVRLDQPSRQHQAPGPGVDEHAVGAANVRGPVGRADLLGDQGVAGGLVGRAQQRLGQAHQRQPLGRRQPELLQESFDHPLPPRQPPRFEHQGDRLGAHNGCVGAERLGLQQLRDGGGFVFVLGVVEARPIRGARRRSWRRWACAHS